MTPEAQARAALKALIKRAGGKSALADVLGVRPQAVDQWDLIPLNRIRAAHKEYGLGLEDLRPDIMELARLKQ